MILGALACLSLLLLLWQWLAARRFPLHRRNLCGGISPPITVLKPLQGCDETTEASLRTWLGQDYPGPVQVLFGVASAEDPVCALVRRLLPDYPDCDAHLLVCTPLRGPNLKVSKLIELERHAKHGVLVISDADVRVPPDLLSNAVAPLGDPGVGLVSCLYRLANLSTLAMRWEAVAINADFWSQVVQARTLRLMDFALGAVMAVRRDLVARMGGFAAIETCLADDYQLGRRVAVLSSRVELCPVVVECWSGAMTWREVWNHQLRWARTIRVCQPVPYFFSILSNATFWPGLWMILAPSGHSLWIGSLILLLRAIIALNLQDRIQERPAVWSIAGLVPLKDLAQVVLWLGAFLGNHISWRGARFRLRRDGTIELRG